MNEYFAILTIRGPQEQGPRTVIIHDENEEKLVERIGEFAGLLEVRRFTAQQTEFWFDDDLMMNFP